MKLQVWSTPDADAQIAELATWWREHRPAARHLFDNEIRRVWHVLAESPKVGELHRVADIPGLRRLRLRKTPYHVYYVPRPEHADVVVLAVWSGMRGEGPALRMP